MKRLAIDAFEVIDNEFFKNQTIKPIISLGINNEKGDEMSKRWNERIAIVLNGLKIDVNNTVQAIRFQLQHTSVEDFDSVMSYQDPESMKMLAAWVFKTETVMIFSFVIIATQMAYLTLTLISPLAMFVMSMLIQETTTIWLVYIDLLYSNSRFIQSQFMHHTVINLKRF